MKINTKTTSSIVNASIILSIMGILSKGIGFIREIIYANNFGLSSEFDLYLASVAFPIVINTAMIYLCQNYFIPVYNKVKRESEEKSNDFFNYNFWWFIFGGLLLAFILYIFSERVLDFYLSSLSDENRYLGIQIFSIFLLTIPINAGMSVITAYLQAEFKFVYPVFAQIVLNIIVIILLIFFTNILHIFILPVAFVTAYFLSFTFLFLKAKNVLRFIPKQILKFKYEYSDISTIAFLVIIEGLSLSYILVDRYFIGKIPEGGVAALNYAFVIFALPGGLFSWPLYTTMFSKFSHSSFNSREAIKGDFIIISGIYIYIFVPMFLILFNWGDVFLKLFYERGAFTSSDTILTYGVLKFYAASLVFYSSYPMVVRLLYSLNKYKIIFIVSIFAFFLKILFNFLLIDNLAQNGLALSSSIVYTFLFLSGFYFAIRNIKINVKSFHLRKLIYFIFNGLISYFIVSIITNISYSHSLIVNVLYIMLFLIIYFFSSMILGEPESKIIKNGVISFVTKNVN